MDRTDANIIIPQQDGQDLQD